MQQAYLDAIKSFEGFTPKATWDYAQHSNGFGTKANSPDALLRMYSVLPDFRTWDGAARVGSGPRCPSHGR